MLYTMPVARSMDRSISGALVAACTAKRASLLNGMSVVAAHSAGGFRRSVKDDVLRSEDQIPLLGMTSAT
jgi:hypothetical protein